MKHKTISLSDDAYKMLKKAKRENESFSQVIIRLANRNSLSDFVGCITEESALKLSDALESFRKKRAEVGRRV